jgi:hypothetical protein
MFAHVREGGHEPTSHNRWLHAGGVSIMKWDYLTAFSYYEEKCKQCKDAHGKQQAHWTLNIFDGNHHWLEGGLKMLGQQGWELVAVQNTEEYVGGAGIAHPPHWYVFKRPIAG